MTSVGVCYNGSAKRGEPDSMLRPKTRWQTVEADQASCSTLADSLGVHPVVARLLVNRGLTEVESARRFLRADASDLHDPFLMDGMEEAVDRVRTALKRNEKILVYGDYDADGVSSTALMMTVFRRLGADAHYYIPNRFREGYGLNKEALAKAKADGVDLVITVDTGISAVEEAAYARELGLDLIITDHHEPPDAIPESLAVINPKKPNCPYPFDMLAGVGVAFKLVQALLGEVPEEVWELAALGTIADLVPLVDENRIITVGGLRRMNQRRHVGLRALMDVSGIRGEVGSGHVGFSLGPRINASGRLDSAVHAVELLLTQDDETAYMMANQLDQMNRERQQLVEEIFEEARAMVEADPDAHRRFIVVASPGWNVGVIGIVASRLVERYYRPTIVLGIDEETGMAKGSARSIEGLDMYRALSECVDLLPHFGGHKMAAGMTLSAQDVPELHRRLDRLASEWLTEEDYIPISRVEYELTPDQVSVELIEQLEHLAPFGVGNPTPRFRVTGAGLSQIQLMGADRNHVKLILSDGNGTLDAVGFRMKELAEEVTPHARIEVLGELQINEWNNKRIPQLLIRDVHVPHVQIFDWRGNGDKRDRLNRLLADPYTLLLTSTPEKAPDRDQPAAWVSWDEWEKEAKMAPDRWSEFRRLVLLEPPPSLQTWERLVLTLLHVERFYFAFGDAEMDDVLLKTPDREGFKQLYGWLLRVQSVRLPRDLQRLQKMTGLSKRMISFMLRVFQELGFVDGSGDYLRVVPKPAKRPLHTSDSYRRQIERERVMRQLVYSSYRELCHYVFDLLGLDLKIGGDENGFQRKDSRDSRLPATGYSV
ncbi:single-stranded-DNA-specific exonuclease RecJ [Polycladomyces abyssicola]|uniref:Single-stranded-DNA-specific exonuclease RecJ n=2 Tax=Polycladomyces abyssicola TaxID=1125966 RepID=A0A8D5UDX6_9BACL|nr:single-stranded-DNA-specific exonuclease RecJ [Polycladomyces abyssicola]